MSTRPQRTMVDRLALRYRTPLISYFRRRGVDDAQCEDLTHEVFARVLKRDADGIPSHGTDLHCFDCPCGDAA
jgi:DNA-directed RNA polymerase specialized sigma24 family protein